jgi:hypothetical protein
MVYQHTKNILGVAAEQQAEGSLQRRAEVSISSPGRSKASRQRTTTEHPAVGTASSPARAPSRLRPSHPNGSPEPMAHRQVCRENNGAHSEYCMHIQRHSGHSKRKWRSLSPEGSGPKAFRSSVRDTCFPKRFRVPNNIVKYDGKTNPSIWLEDYHLACRAGRADSDLFIIQLLPIYLVDTSRA